MARDLQIAFLRKNHGLTYRQAALVASWCFGEVV